ncbi:MAG TPA: phage shock protein PspA, partial [Halieaceae bacterium]|nr:phage shock protein PspA [Halieaceae bacterium]
APDLAAEIASLEEDERISDELQRLKAEMSGGTEPRA